MDLVLVVFFARLFQGRADQTHGIRLVCGLGVVLVVLHKLGHRKSSHKVLAIRWLHRISSGVKGSALQVGETGRGKTRNVGRQRLRGLGRHQSETLSTKHLRIEHVGKSLGVW